jgi:hypothetical protein
VGTVAASEFDRDAGPDSRGRLGWEICAAPAGESFEKALEVISAQATIDEIQLILTK